MKSERNKDRDKVGITIDHEFLNRYGVCVVSGPKYREYIYNQRRYIGHMKSDGVWDIEEVTPTKGMTCSFIGCNARATYWQNGYFVCVSHLGNMHDSPAIKL